MEAILIHGIIALMATTTIPRYYHPIEMKHLSWIILAPILSFPVTAILSVLLY